MSEYQFHWLLAALGAIVGGQIVTNYHLHQLRRKK